jgi:3-dehydroquinate synthase
MNNLTISLTSKKKYPIYIGEHLLDNAELVSKYIQPLSIMPSVMIVSDETVSRLYLKKLLTSLGNLSHNIVLIPEGEEHKTLETWQQILEALFLHGHTRHTLLIALGGGIVNDIAGFAAATYQRGIPWISIPTTLLAQVDASIGGKTGVNHPCGKNMIGAFHQPNCVLIDTSVLESLHQRQYNAGLAEIIKYGLVYDAEFFTWLETNMVSCVRRVPTVITEAIQRACEIKAAIVVTDEKDTEDKRAILNFGHTFGHAMENVAGYGTLFPLLHGEAIAIGMVMAVTLSVQAYGLPETVLNRVKNILHQAQLPTERPTTLSPERIIKTMRMDKKNQKSALRLILLKSMGEAVVTSSVPMDQIKKIIRDH